MSGPDYDIGSVLKHPGRGPWVRHRRGHRRAANTGASVRCKGLKVKFITDLDTCKHCLNGGHECVIPECKRRSSFLVRAPALADPSAGERDPQLEEANRRAEAHTPGDASSPSPSPSGTTESFSLISRLASPEVEATDERHVQEMQGWIAKAHTSIQAFGSYISMGRPNTTREMLVADDDVDESAGRAAAGGEGEYTYTIPNEAEPFGLIAQLGLHKGKSLRRIKSKSDIGGAGGEEKDENDGLANDDHLPPSLAVERPLV